MDRNLLGEKNQILAIMKRVFLYFNNKLFEMPTQSQSLINVFVFN